MSGYIEKLLRASGRNRAAFAALCVERVLPVYRGAVRRSRSAEPQVQSVLDQAWIYASTGELGLGTAAATEAVSAVLDSYDDVASPTEEAAAQVVTAAKRLGHSLLQDEPGMTQAAVEACLEAVAVIDENDTGMEEEEEAWQREALLRVLQLPARDLTRDVVHAAVGGNTEPAWLDRWDR